MTFRAGLNVLNVYVGQVARGEANATQHGVETVGLQICSKLT